MGTNQLLQKMKLALSSQFHLPAVANSNNVFILISDLGRFRQQTALVNNPVAFA